jgi:hypothetical protein
MIVCWLSSCAAGTTATFDMLRAHPQIVTSRRVHFNGEKMPKLYKEITFFEKDRLYHEHGLYLYERIIKAQETSDRLHVCLV